VDLEFCILPEQHNIAHSKARSVCLLHMQDLAVVDEWKHAAASGLKTKSEAAGEQALRKFAEYL
jgi:DNA-binding SARP family transcriptional activator